MIHTGHLFLNAAYNLVQCLYIFIKPDQSNQMPLKVFSRKTLNQHKITIISCTVEGKKRLPYTDTIPLTQRKLNIVL